MQTSLNPSVPIPDEEKTFLGTTKKCENKNLT